MQEWQKQVGRVGIGKPTQITTCPLKFSDLAPSLEIVMPSLLNQLHIIQHWWAFLDNEFNEVTIVFTICKMSS